MMLDDLRALLAHTQADATRAGYATAIVTDNVLGKSTKKARELALRYLGALYGLESSNAVFRALRRLWPLDESAQPVLALAVALARDPLLRSSQEFMLAQPQGGLVTREEVEALLSNNYPGRFTAASIKSFAQNVAGTWTAAGVLVGHRRKTRSAPAVRPEAIAFLMFLGYLEGRTGQRLFSSEWMRLLGVSPDELEALANSASHRGLLVFMSAGGVTEVRFPGYLTAEEERIRQEVSHVI
ncbi:hypothetical protein SAMN05518800_1200 [Variovorax sp. YR752]|nr:hypothetical protein SAMN05518800_1200 [Variovorax sp. YR752]